MKRSFIQSLLSASGLILFFHAITSFAVMAGLSTADLARSSGAVITGEVVQSESFRSEDGKTILTKASVVVTEVVRGVVDEKTVIVEYEGGEVGGVGLRVSDIAPLVKGERVLLFLTKEKSRADKAEIHRIVGKGQGKYTIDEKGIARKRGFSVARDNEVIDNDIPVEDLKEKIRRVR